MRHWAIGADRDLESRSRTERQQAKGREVEADRSGQEVQDQKRGENRVQRAVQLSQRVADGEGAGTRRVAGMIQKTVEMVG